jgi:uncharacterized membrane protein (DUF2068 family)
MTATATQIAPKRRTHHAGLVVIAGYKLLGALAFLAIGVGALRLIHKNIDDVLWYALIEVLHRNPESHFVNFIFEKAELLNDPLLKRISFAAFCYTGLHILEAIGLYLEKTWGEILTTFITASFLPFEVHEVIKRLTWLRCGFLAVNLLVVGYLVWIIAQRAAARARTHRAAAHAE